MKLLIKLTWVAFISSSFLGLSPAARAIFIIVNKPVDYTYEFTAAAGHSTEYNGSTITIQDNGGIYSYAGWDLTDGTSVDTPQNSTMEAGFYPVTINSANASGFMGQFNVEGVASEFYGRDTLIHSPLDALASFENGVPVVDPPGTWTYVPAPDATNTFGLLLAGVCSLGVWRSRLAGRLSGRS
jgi:hypothetical protein